jgi:hypothetical protein
MLYFVSIVVKAIYDFACDEALFQVLSFLICFGLLSLLSLTSR